MEQQTPAAPEAGTNTELGRALKRIEELQEALESRVLIEQAKGVLRERFGWDVDDAFEILRYAARSSRTKIHALAAQVVASDETPQAVVVALARGARWRAAHMRERAEAQRRRAAEPGAGGRARRERIGGGRARDGRARDEPQRRRPGQALRVIAPTYAAARQLLQRTSIAFTAEVTPSRDGRWEVNLYESSPTSSGVSEQLVNRALGIVQEWVCELDARVEVVLGDRRFTMHPC